MVRAETLNYHAKRGDTPPVRYRCYSDAEIDALFAEGASV